MRPAPLLVAACLAACSSSHPPPEHEPAAVGATASSVIGPAGGVLELEGAVRLEVPPGALSSEQAISVTVTDGRVPSGFTGFSPVLRFEPAGTRFEVPVRVSLPYSGDAELATVFWTRAGGGSYLALATDAARGLAHAEVTHFSQAFVGSGCAGEDCCRRATSELDVLFLVDNSNSMTEEQASLAEQLPRMAQVLATGDLDADGVQDFPAVASLHTGVVSSDMGTGGFTVPTCAEPAFGDDGVLRTEGNVAVAGCHASYPKFLEYDGHAGGDPAVFASDFRCVAQLGTGGCGFEQQLESALKAVTPSSSPLTFTMGSTGHADGANAGFLRSESVTALVLITDEDDCSAADPELFDPSSSTYAGNLNLRCATYPAAVHPVERYVEGLLAMRADPAKLVFATISGVPSDLTSSPGAVNYDALLADERMQERTDPSSPERLAPSCDLPERGLAFPPRRLVQTARDLERAGAHSVVHSICTEDYTPALDAILTRVADSLRGACG